VCAVRKTRIVKPVDLRDAMNRAGIDARKLSSYLDFGIKYTYKLISGYSDMELDVACTCVKLLGPLTLDVDGTLYHIGIVDKLPRPDIDATGLSPGEAGWILQEEIAEAQRCMTELLKAVRTKDFDALVHSYEQVFCDQGHAIRLLEAAVARELGELYGPVKQAAVEHHRQKVAAKAA
jgi:hypothetical protein